MMKWYTCLAIQGSVYLAVSTLSWAMGWTEQWIRPDGALFTAVVCVAATVGYVCWERSKRSVGR